MEWSGRRADYVIKELDARFGRRGGITFAEMFGGIVAILTAAQSRAIIAVQGAQVLSYETPAGEVLWLSPVAKLGTGKAVRGGIPVCWPWFGPHPADAAKPAHGFVRAAEWSVIGSAQGVERARVVMAFDDQRIDKTLWPHKARAEIEVTLDDALTVTLSTTNSGSSPLVLTEALHTYLRVGDIAEISVTGLDGRAYINQLQPGSLAVQAGAIGVSGEVDRVYQHSDGEVAVTDGARSRIIRVTKAGSRSTVVWNPGSEKAARLGDLGDDGYRRMVCIEAGNVLDEEVTLAPGERHRLTTKISATRR